MVEVLVSGRRVQALLDTGCSQTIAARSLVRDVVGCGGSVTTVDGREAALDGKGQIELAIGGHNLSMECLILSRLLPMAKLILGMDMVKKLGGVFIDGVNNEVKFGLSSHVATYCESRGISARDSEADRPTGDTAAQCSGDAMRACSSCHVSASEDGIVQQDGGVAAEELAIDDVDFSAYFDGSCWIVKWKWINEVPILTNQVGMYKLAPKLKGRFEEEVTQWIQDGILMPVGKENKIDSVVPLVAVEQTNKDKVRPVLDFRELNKFISCHSGEARFAMRH